MSQAHQIKMFPRLLFGPSPKPQSFQLGYLLHYTCQILLLLGTETMNEGELPQLQSRRYECF